MPSSRRTEGAQFISFLISVLSLLRPLTPLRGIEVVVSLELHPGDLLDDIDQLIDGDQFVAAEIERLDDVTLGHEHDRAPGAVVDVHEAARLFAVAPDLDLVLAGSLAAITLRQIAAGAFSRPPS